MNHIHSQIETWMVAALTDALSAAERNTFDAHLHSCARCRQLFADQQTVSTLLEQAFAPDQPDDEFEERMVEQFRQNVAKKKHFALPDLRKVREAWLAFCRFPAVHFAAAAVIVALLVVLGGALSGEVNLSFWGNGKKPVLSLANLRQLDEAVNSHASSHGKFPIHTVGIGDTEPPETLIRLNPNQKTGVAKITFGPNWDGESVVRMGIPLQDGEFVKDNKVFRSPLTGLITNESGVAGLSSLEILSDSTNLSGNSIRASGDSVTIMLGGSGTTSTAFPVFANRITEADGARWAMNSGTVRILNGSTINMEVTSTDVGEPIAQGFSLGTTRMAPTIGLLGLVDDSKSMGGDVRGSGLVFRNVVTNAAGGYVDLRTDPNKPANFDYATNDKSRFDFTSGFTTAHGGTVTLPDNFLGGNGVVTAVDPDRAFIIAGGAGTFANQIATTPKEGGWKYKPGETDEFKGFQNYGGIGYGDRSEQNGRLVNEGQGEVDIFKRGRLSFENGATLMAEATGASKQYPKVYNTVEGTAFDFASRGSDPKKPEGGDMYDDFYSVKNRPQIIDAIQQLAEAEKRAQEVRAQTEGQLALQDGKFNFKRDADAYFLNVEWKPTDAWAKLNPIYWSAPVESSRLIFAGGTMNTEVTNPDQPINQGSGTIIITGSITNRSAGGGSFTTGVPEVKPPQQPAQNPPPNRLAQQPPPRQQPRQQPPQKGAPTPQPPVGVTEVRKLIRSAQMEFEVDSYDQTMLRVQEIVGEERGLLVTSNSSRLPNGKVRGDVVIKVLPDFLERLVWKLRGIGELKKQTLGSQDVTKQYFDTEARKRNLEAMEKRLLEMLARVQGKVPELLEVEKEIARVRAEIEGLQGELKYVDTLVAYATINLTLYEKDLNQAAAFQLKEKANLSIFSPDVEKTLNDAKRSAETAKAQVLHSKLDRETSGRVTGTFSVLVAPDVADLLLESFRNLGRVSSLNRTSERVAIGGQGGSDTAKVEKDKVEINLVIVHDDESRRRVRLVVVTKAVEESLEKAKAAATKHSAEVLLSNFTRPSAGESAAQFTVRVPAKAYEAMLGELKAFGRVAEFNVELKENNTESKENTAPVLVALVLASSEPPLQITHLAVQRQGVEAVLDKLKTDAVKLGGEIRASNFVRSPDGQELANLAFRIPLKDNGALVEMLKAYGDVKSFTVERQDRVQEGKPDENAPAEVRLQFFSHQAPMQITQLGIERKDVESVLAALKEQATKLGAEIRASNFVRYPNGQELANLAFRLPMKQNQQLLDLLKSLGDIKGYTVERQDRLTESKVDENAPAEIRLQLGSAPPIIEQDSGFMVTMKQTIGQGFAKFMWGIKMIGIALAFVAPWLAALAVLWWGFKKLRRKKVAAKA